MCGLALSCGPASRRDLGAIAQRAITYDDMCHLQDYFDQRREAHPAPFRVVDEQSREVQASEPDENGRLRHAMEGEGTYVMTDRPARRRLRRIIEDEYERVPPVNYLTTRDAVVRVHVHWWASGQIRRLRPDKEIVVGVEGGASTTLPFNPCIGELLFGDEAYAIRRRVLDAERQGASGAESTVSPSAASPSAASDSGATTDAASDAANTAPGSPDATVTVPGVDAGGGS